MRRGPMIRDAVGQFVHDVPSPKPEPFLDSDPLHWIANALLYVASSSSSKRNHNVVGGPSGLCPFCPLRFQPLIPQRLLNPAITQHPSFRVPFSCVAPIFGFSSFAFTPVFCALSRHSTGICHISFNRFISACYSRFTKRSSETQETPLIRCHG